VDASHELSESPRKKQRHSTQVPIKLGEQFRGIDVSGIDVVTNLLEGKEFCVLTDWEEHTKQDIETKIVQNGGTVVQNTGISMTY
jgi:DNA ligase-4